MPTTTSHVFPVLRYRDPQGAIDFLVEAFGFERLAAYANDDGLIVHAELRIGQGVVMLGLLSPDASARGQTVSGGTTSIYVSVSDADAHHTRAVAAGAVVTRAVSDMDYGSREYSCRDLEGHEWHFGTYDPQAPKPG